MDSFSIGIASLVLAILFPVLYIIVLQGRKIAAWSKRKEGPKDRVGFFIIMFAIFGFVLGSFAQPLVTKASECIDANEPVVSCVLFSK